MDILQHRLYHQQISQHQFNKAEDVVAHFGAMQAQDYAMAKWAIGLRLDNTTDAAIEKALNDGHIIRTHVMRPTWHLVHPDDICWMLQLTAGRVKAGMASREKQLGLSDKIFNRCNDIIVRALEGGNHLTRPELMWLIEQAGINTDEYRSGHIAMHAELDGLICSGARRGKEFTYALLTERIPVTDTIDRDEALERLTIRYFTAHGPATMHDFAWWSGLTLSDVKRGIDIANKALYFKEINGLIYWLAIAAPNVVKPAKGVFILPNYDEYTVGYANREALTDASHINSRENVLFSNVVVINGEIKGTWKRTLKKDTLLFEPQLFKRLSKAHETALWMAVKRYAKFLGLTISAYQ